MTIFRQRFVPESISYQDVNPAAQQKIEKNKGERVSKECDPFKLSLVPTDTETNVAANEHGFLLKTSSDNPRPSQRTINNMANNETQVVYAGDSFCQNESAVIFAEKEPLLGPTPSLSPRNVDLTAASSNKNKKSGEHIFAKSHTVQFNKSKTLNERVIDSVQSSANMTN